MVLTFLTVTEKPFPQAMQFCTSLSSAHFLVRDCDCLIYTTTKPTTQSSKSSNLAKCQHLSVLGFVHFVLLLFLKLAVLHDWPGATGSLCRAPAWLLWCLPVSSSAPPLWPAVSRFHLHPLHTWTQPEDTKECMFKFNLAKVNWTEVPRNWNTSLPSLSNMTRTQPSQGHPFIYSGHRTTLTDRSQKLQQLQNSTEPCEPGLWGPRRLSARAPSSLQQTMTQPHDPSTLRITARLIFYSF